MSTLIDVARQSPLPIVVAGEDPNGPYLLDAPTSVDHRGNLRPESSRHSSRVHVPYCSRRSRTRDATVLLEAYAAGVPAASSRARIGAMPDSSRTRVSPGSLVTPHMSAVACRARAADRRRGVRASGYPRVASLEAALQPGTGTQKPRSCIPWFDAAPRDATVDAVCPPILCRSMPSKLRAGGCPLPSRPPPCDDNAPCCAAAAFNPSMFTGTLNVADSKAACRDTAMLSCVLMMRHDLGSAWRQRRSSIRPGFPPRCSS